MTVESDLQRLLTVSRVAFGTPVGAVSDMARESRSGVFLTPPSPSISNLGFGVCRLGDVEFPAVFSGHTMKSRLYPIPRGS